MLAFFPFFLSFHDKITEFPVSQLSDIRKKNIACTLCKVCNMTEIFLQGHTNIFKAQVLCNLVVFLILFFELNVDNL